MIKTIVDTIIWLAQQRLEEQRFQNINSAIVSITNDVSLELCEFMATHKKRKANG